MRISFVVDVLWLQPYFEWGSVVRRNAAPCFSSVAVVTAANATAIPHVARRSGASNGVQPTAATSRAIEENRLTAAASAAIGGGKFRVA